MDILAFSADVAVHEKGKSHVFWRRHDAFRVLINDEFVEIFRLSEDAVSMFGG